MKNHGQPLNDKEQDAERQCGLVVLAGHAVIDPKSVSGYKYLYSKSSQLDSKPSQKIVLKCDEYVATILTLELDQQVRLPIPADDHYSIWGGHENGRSVLGKEWKALPAPLRRTVKSAYALTASDGNTFNYQLGYR